MKLYEPFAAGTLPRLDRIIVAGLLLLVAALAWAFTVHQAILMDEMEAAMWRDMNMSMNGMAPSWNAIDAVMLFVMWSAMMAAMMIPGASPMITAFATIIADGRRAPHPTCQHLPSSSVTSSSGTGFSVVATALQWLLQTLGLLTTTMQSSILLLVSSALCRGRSLPTQPIEGECAWRIVDRPPVSF